MPIVKSSFRKLIDSFVTPWKRITTRSCTTFFGHDAPTPVHIAAKYGNVNAIRVLAALGADVCAAANTGLTPLHIAAQYGHVDAIKGLAVLGGG
jgi:ankyrin repeat protein